MAKKSYLARHRPPRQTFSHSAVAAELRGAMRATGRKQFERGQSRLRELAKRRRGKPWGRHEIGYLKTGLGQAYISQATEPELGILS
jgi:hypothetical protein